MGKLTAELIHKAPKFVNTLKERELDLRGNKIPEIENLGATEDQYDTIDLSDNEIAKLENFPQMPHLRTLLLNNNKISKAVKGLSSNLPNLESLVLTNNKFQDLVDIEPIGEFKSLEMLILTNNPVQKKPHYRAFLIYHLPKLRILDFKKVAHQERAEARKMFEGEKGQEMLEQLLKHKSLVTDTVANGDSAAASEATGLTDEQKAKLRAAIANAQTTEELNRLEAALQSGKIPKEML